MIVNRLFRTRSVSIALFGLLVVAPLALAKPAFKNSDVTLDGVDENGNRSAELGGDGKVKIKLIKKGFIAIAHGKVQNLSDRTQKYKGGGFAVTIDSTMYTGTEKSYVVTRKGRANLVAKGSNITEVEEDPAP